MPYQKKLALPVLTSQPNQDTQGTTQGEPQHKNPPLSKRKKGEELGKFLWCDHRIFTSRLSKMFVFKS